MSRSIKSFARGIMEYYDLEKEWKAFDERSFVRYNKALLIHDPYDITDFDDTTCFDMKYIDHEFFTGDNYDHGHYKEDYVDLFKRLQEKHPLVDMMRIYDESYDYDYDRIGDALYLRYAPNSKQLSTYDAFYSCELERHHFFKNHILIQNARYSNGMMCHN